jgi:hypothetical protein
MGPNLIIAAVVLLQSSTPQNSPSPTLQNPDTVSSANSAAGPGYERLSDALQYNRVQGLSLGVGYRLPLSGRNHWIVYPTLRYGLSDERLTARLSVTREAPALSLALSGYHDISDVDPFASGRSFGNTLNSLFAGHDNGDYLLADGGSVTFDLPFGSSTALRLSTAMERQRSISRAAESRVNDFLGGSGVFPLNPDIRDGVFARVLARISRHSGPPLNVSMDVMAGEGETVARLYGDARASAGWRRQLLLRIKAGIGTEPGMPQTLFRVGGVHTVRGFEYGAIRSPSFWAAQLDLSPVGGRIRPVAFLDGGQGGRLKELFSRTVLVGGGLGLSLLHDLVRLDFSRPLLPREAASKVRFDITLLGVH